MTTLPVPGEDAAPPVRDVLLHLWGQLPPLVARAKESDRFVFSITFRTRDGGACELYVSQNIGAGTLLRTVARKLARQIATVERRDTGPMTVGEVSDAAWAMDALAQARAPIEWVA